MSWGWYSLRVLRVTFTSHTQRVGKKNSYKYTCDLSRLRALFEQPFKYRKPEENNHSNIHAECIIKWYADKLQPTHILSIFDIHTRTLCSLDINPFDLFRLTFLTMVCARCMHVQCAQITWNRSDLTVYGVLVSRCHVQPWKFTSIRLFCVKYGTWYMHVFISHIQQYFDHRHTRSIARTKG